jgi:hypothetical protein
MYLNFRFCLASIYVYSRAQVVEAMEFAVYRDDIEHVILDNLQVMNAVCIIRLSLVTILFCAAFFVFYEICRGQFMMPRLGVSGGSFQKFDMQDAVIDRFRSFATEKNVNFIQLVLNLLVYKSTLTVHGLSDKYYSRHPSQEGRRKASPRDIVGVWNSQSDPGG